VPSDGLVASDPEQLGNLWGDKAYSSVFDNTKLRGLVPDFHTHVHFAEGIARTVAWFDADPSRRQVDEALASRWDGLIAAYESGLSAARRELNP